MARSAPSNPDAQTARVIERAENHRIWERVHAVANDVNGAAQVQFVTNRYTELGAGLCYRQPDGSWADSHAEVVLTPGGGAEAKQLPHKVQFAPNINTVAAIRMTLPDGKLMSSTPRGVYLYDSSTKERLVLGVITNSTGVIVPPNLVVYSNCFAGLDADLVFKVTPAGLEQDIAIRESLDWIPLDELGLDPKSTVLEAWTEFYAAPKPAKTKGSIGGRRVKGAEVAELADEKLDFGSIIMRPGRAYSTRDQNPRVGLEGHGHEPGSIAVGKMWLDAENDRRFLIESVRWRELLPHFEGLKKGSALNNAAFRPDPRSRPVATPELPPALMAQVSSDRMLVAQHAPANTPAFILDYATLNGYYPSYTFAPDQTYYISGGVYIDNADFHGGTVIKMAPMDTYAGIYISGSARFKAEPGRMVIITGKDDNSVGEWIDGSTGNPTVNYYGNPALSFEYGAAAVDMKYVRISHAGQAVQFYNAAQENRVRHCQFVRAVYGILCAENSLTLHNVLLTDTDTYFFGYSFTAYGEHLTIHGGWIVGDDGGGASLTLVNSLIVGPDSWMAISVPSPSVWLTPEPVEPVFQTMGFGAHYLAANSPYRGIGNPDINPELREAFKQKTTHPPTGLPGGSLVDVTLAPHVPRNSGLQPDLGYAYDVLDYQGGGLYMQSGATLLLTNGVAVSLNAGAISWGIRLMSGTKIISEGTPVNPNRLVEMRSVQEQYGGWVYPGFSSIYCEYASGAYPQVQLRFTEILGRAGLDWHIYRNGGLTSISLRDSEMFGGGITGSFTDPSAHNVDLINSLFEWSRIVIEANGGTRLSVQHNTFTNGQIRFIGQDPSNSRFRDNLVDKVNLSVSPLFPITGNGYYVTPALQGSPPQHTLLSPVNYQVGPLGDFYLPAGSSPLLSGGSQSPTASGLFHYTTQVGQQKEGSKTPDPMGNIKVDVGYHYVALNSANLALNKTASQSSTDFGGPASRAVDGNTDGNWSGASVTHTAYEEEPWWQVDLGAVSSVREIKIWNRTDCCGTRLSSFYVFASDTPFQYSDVASTLAQPGVSAQFITGPAGTPTSITVARTARYVRVQLTTTDYLSLAEVQVFGPYSPIDSDGDGLADYVEDRNGNNIVDAGESSPYNPDTDNDCLPDFWEVTHGTNPSIADTTADPDLDVLNNLAEYLAGTHPNIPDIGYIPNNKNGQAWPATVPIPAPQVGAPTQEREFKFKLAGLTSIRPNDGLARALAERIDSILRTAAANRANWAVYAALQPFPSDGDVHNIVNPTDNAFYRLEELIPTHTAFMDIYFETADNLCYTYDAEARLRRRRPNTERWYNWIKNSPAPTAGAAGFTEQEGLNNRIEFMSKVDRFYDPINRPGWSEVTESRNRDVIPWFSALNVQGRLNDYQDGRWPADLQLRRQVWTDPIVPSADAGKVCNAAWKLREYLVKKLNVPFDFACPTTYAGLYSFAVATGDFNGDGRPDVAMANYAANNVRIYLCNANGTFTLGGTFAVGTAPVAITVADFNQNGSLDLAVVNKFDSPGRTSVLMGNGNGTFAAAVHYNVGVEPDGVASGKFNADAYPDLVVGNYDHDTVSVLLNNGNGTFAAKVDYPAGASPRAVAVGDFNGDGRGDIAVALVDEGVGILLANANGSGTFGTVVKYAAGSGPIDIATGEFNGDGHVDLAVVNNSGWNLSVLLGTGSGTFGAAANYPVTTLPSASPTAVAVGDYNGDQIADLAVAINYGEVGLLKGNGNGTFAAPVSFTVGPETMAVAAGDFNQDGFPDLAVGSYQSANSLKILLNEAGTDIFKLRPKVVIFQERRRQHFELRGPNNTQLLLSFVPGVMLDNTFIVTVDAVYAYKQDEMLAFMKQEPGSFLPQPVGSFVEVEVEFERDTSDTLDDMINVQPPRADKPQLQALQAAFFQDAQKIIDLVTSEFNNKPHDLTEFYTIKAGDQLLVDLSTHAEVTETTGTGVQMGVPGQFGTGLAFDGNGYVSYVAQAQAVAPVATVEANPTFVLTEFQSRGTPYAVNGDDNRDAIQDENGARNDWIEIQNVTASVQSLSGWSVRDSQVTYTIPAGISVPPGGFVIVFADDGNAGLHANFRITGGGEYLALQRPDGLGGWIIATEYNGPAIPNFEYDISYGIVPNGSGWTEGFLHATPGEPNEGIYQRVPMNLGTADFTISLWLKTSEPNVAILSKGDNDGTAETGEKQLYLSTGKVRYFGQGQNGVIAGNTAVNNNVWRHIAITFAGGVGKVYVDGADDTTVANYTPIADAASARLLLGFAAGIANFDGVLDDVAIWNRALSLTEIQAIRNAGSSVNTRAHIPGGLLFHTSMDVSLQPEAATKYRQAVDLLP